MMPLASFNTESPEWIVQRNGTDRVGVTSVPEQTVVIVDGFPAAPIPQGAQLLSNFLDQFESDPAIATHITAARQHIANESIKIKKHADLRDLRLRKGLSQKDLAAQLNTCQSRVSLLESRRERPTEETLRSLARALEVDFNTLMDALEHGDH